jgi:membrane peptidoglycan carboxypeptidase
MIVLQNIIKKRITAVIGVVVLVALAIATMMYWLVVVSPGEEISQGNIERLLAMESPVFYRDGQTPLGVFFEDAHRQYISYAQIPKDFVNALIAAEDNTYFEHHGVDFMGLIRAMSANIRAGRVVQVDRVDRVVQVDSDRERPHGRRRQRTCGL